MSSIIERYNNYKRTLFITRAQVMAIYLRLFEQFEEKPK